MKYIAKNNNYRVVLKHGQPAEPITGRAAVPGMYVKFEQGIANVEEDEMNKLMQAHVGFGSDFILSEDDKDPFATNRQEPEPQHLMMEIDKGTVGKSTGGKPVVTFTPAQRKVMEATAKKMALEIAPKIAKEILTSLAKKSDDGEKQAPDDAEKQAPEAETTDETKE